jgi:hypothetical protein
VVQQWLEQRGDLKTSLDLILNQLTPKAASLLYHEWVRIWIDKKLFALQLLTKAIPMISNTMLTGFEDLSVRQWLEQPEHNEYIIQLLQLPTLSTRKLLEEAWMRTAIDDKLLTFKEFVKAVKDDLSTDVVRGRRTIADIIERKNPAAPTN